MTRAPRERGGRPGRETSGEPVIVLRDATFGYGDRPVVRDVDLEVDRGDVIAVLGANGSGKSTLVKGMLGLTDQLGGEVELFGRPLARFRQRYLIGYVPQRHTLSSAVPATVAEIVAVGRLPHQGWLARMSAKDKRIVAESLELVGLDGFERRDASALSGGQQRRVLIARALAAQPEVLVMDEPTAGVDAASQHVLVDVLARLVARGVTMLIVTHEVAPLRPILTRVVTMSGGRKVFDGPADRLDVSGDLSGEWIGHRVGDHHHHDERHHEDPQEHHGGSVGLADPAARPARRDHA